MLPAAGMNGGPSRPLILPDSMKRFRHWPAAAGILITAFWLTMMYTLVKDKILPARRAQELAAITMGPDELLRGWQDVAESMLVTFNGGVVGSASTSIVKTTETLSRYNADFRLGISPSFPIITQNLSIIASGELDERFQVQRFRLKADMAGFKFETVGYSTGDVLYVKTERGETVLKQIFNLDKPLSLLEAVRPAALHSLEIKPGKSVSVPVADPIWSMQLGDMIATVVKAEKVSVAGDELDAFLVETSLGDFVTKSWVDAKGTTLKRQLVGGFYLERAPRDKPMPPVSHQQIPKMNVAEFAGIQPKPLGTMADKKSSIWSILGEFAP
ncbi:MAG: hypothetical protein K1X53_12835 [Candidatus Sumerlaeaceae bacterium]|nr:hypothetical protein [Candidatus Sumerlaeaceae bacterium]